jgi:GAF domain-containing protein
MSPEASTIAGDQSMEELRRELAEAREQQAATAEILTSISSSATDAKQVFVKIAASAARLCDAYDVVIRKVDGEALRLVAHHGPIAVASTLPLMRGYTSGRVVLDRQTIHVADLQVEGEQYPEGRDNALRVGFHTSLSVPLVHAGEAIGVIVMRRAEVRPFTDRQIDLLKTFADQAVIAIENARLFEAEQARTRELAESLEQQTATADVLKVISRSALNLRGMLDALVESAARLCNAYDATILQVFGDGLRLVAHHGQIPTPGPVGQYTGPLVRERIAARAVIDRRTIHVADILAEADEYPESRKNALEIGWRTALAVPLVHAGEAIGAIFIRRAEVRPFTERQIELVNIFADQAVIAIENARLFEAEQASKRELQESLEYQTATSDVLNVISRSPNELQPVFNGIVATAQRLCEAYDASIVLREGERLKLKAHVGPIPMRTEWPLGNRGLVVSRSVIGRKTIHVHDLAAAEAEFPEGRVGAPQHPSRTAGAQG